MSEVEQQPRLPAIDPRLADVIRGRRTIGAFRPELPPREVILAALDVARTTCRRAERRVVVIHEAGQLENPEVIIYLNRLSDLLWLLARWVETHAAGK